MDAIWLKYTCLLSFTQWFPLFILVKFVSVTIQVLKLKNPSRQSLIGFVFVTEPVFRLCYSGSVMQRL